MLMSLCPLKNRSLCVHKTHGGNFGESWRIEDKTYLADISSAGDILFGSRVFIPQ